MKKILVFAYPFDELERIVDYSVRLARDLELPLEFIHIVETPVLSVDPALGGMTPAASFIDTVPTDFVENRTRLLQKVLSVKNASMQFPVAYSYTVVAGSIHAAISDTAERKDIELVLVPNPGESADSYIINEIIDGIRQPVFAFPLKSEYHPIKRIFYATDYLENDRLTLRSLAALAKKVMASVTVFHISKEPDYEEHLKSLGLKDLLQKQPEFRGIEVTETRSSQIINGIRSFSRRNYADLVVLLKQNKSFLRELFSGSTSKSFVGMTNVPVLIYHEQ